MAPGKSRLAYLTPDASPVSYWKLPEAAAARPLLDAAAALIGCCETRRALEPSAAGEAMAAEVEEGKKAAQRGVVEVL